MKFKSKKDNLFLLLTFIFITSFCGIILYRVIYKSHHDNVIILIYFLMTMIIVLLLSINFGTEYEITKNQLKYKCGPFKGKIDIARIKEIEKGKTQWTGLKFATSRNGLIIKYDKYESIYISPESNDLFIDKILVINNQIKIKTY